MGAALSEAADYNEGESFYIVTRPENVRYSKEPVAGFELYAKVKEFIYVGNIIKTIFTLSNGQEIKMNRMKKDKELAVGDCIYLYWEPEESVAVASETNSLMKLLNDNQKEDEVNG